MAGCSGRGVGDMEVCTETCSRLSSMYLAPTIRSHPVPTSPFDPECAFVQCMSALTGMMRARAQTHMATHTHGPAHTWTHTHVHTQNTHALTHTCTHAHARIRTHTHAHARRQAGAASHLNSALVSCTLPMTTIGRRPWCAALRCSTNRSMLSNRPRGPRTCDANARNACMWAYIVAGHAEEGPGCPIGPPPEANLWAHCTWAATARRAQPWVHSWCP